MFELEYRIATRERKLYELFKNILKGFWFNYLEILNLFQNSSYIA
jgi:hypothetical protein